MIIRTRDDLLSWLDEHAPSASFRRALQEGQIQNLGFFEQVPRSSHKGWIIKVITRFGKMLYVAVIQDRHTFRYRCYELENLFGAIYKGGTTILYKGDEK